jgi:hypothetical protein
LHTDLVVPKLVSAHFQLILRVWPRPRAESFT